MDQPVSIGDDFLQEALGAFGAMLEQEQSPKTPQLVTCQIERGLLPEDIRDYLNEHGQLATTTKAEQKDIRLLRERHHGVARLIAEGVPQAVVAVMSDYEASYLSTLLQSPAMIELIEFYRSSKNAAATHIGENLRLAAGLSLEQLTQKAMVGELSNNELIQVAKLGFDRSGHGPQSSIHNVTEHHLIPPDVIRARHQQAKERDREIIVHPEEVRPALLPPPDEAGEDEAA